MEHELKIFIEQLQEGEQEKVNLTVSSEFLDIQETDLIFDSPVSIEGEVYVTDHHLIIHVDAKTKAKIRCAICNDLTESSLAAQVYESLPLSELDSSIFDYSSLLKEELLLQIPLFTECQGSCPERSNLKSFLKDAPPKKASLPSTTHFPFADL